VVIFFRAPGGRSIPQAPGGYFLPSPGGRGIYKKPLEPTQRPTNPYMGWATPQQEPLHGTTNFVYSYFQLHKETQSVVEYVNCSANRQDKIWEDEL
jgi:hypothetical protein